MRTPVMAGNWKMFKTAAQTRSYFEAFRPLVASTKDREIVICPPYLCVPAAVESVQGTGIEIGAQNMHWVAEGAYTGEVSAPMLLDAGCRWVIIGHSERRQYFHETDEWVRRRTEAALEAGLKPIVCVGETLAEREEGRTVEVLERQFQGGLHGLKPESFANVVVAYEPVWAIGTGRTATPEMAEEAHKAIRTLAQLHYGDAAAQALRILYGGSVKPDNAASLMAKSDIDGVLVGGASLDPKGFATIVNA